jgi:hypothetical protein
MNRFALVVCLCGFTLLGGCASAWKKPGVSKPQVAQDLAACGAAAELQVPVRMQLTQIEPGYWLPAQSHCRQDRHGDTDCTYYPPQFVPPVTVDLDVNSDARDAVKAACMRGRGYVR